MLLELSEIDKGSDTVSEDIDISNCNISSQSLAELVQLTDDGVI
jgi:hypothetical protein